MVFASGVIVSAEDNNELVNNMKSATLVRRAPAPTILGCRHGDFKVVIDKLVEEGKLTREKADQIDKFIQQKKADQKNLQPEEKKNLRKDHKHGLVNDLVNAKIINDAEATLIRDKFREIKEALFNEKLNAMVQKGTITPAQADKVKVYFENARKERMEMHKQLQNMTEEQRRAFFKEHNKDNAMNKLVEDGILTKEQAEELRDSFKEGHDGKHKEQ
jgi:polyhydroxyalkanoate synthesis regulator phasin